MVLLLQLFGQDLEVEMLQESKGINVTAVILVGSQQALFKGGLLGIIIQNFPNTSLIGFTPECQMCW